MLMHMHVLGMSEEHSKGGIDRKKENGPLLVKMHRN